MNTKQLVIETGFYFRINDSQKKFIITYDGVDLLAIIWLTYRLKQNHKSQYYLGLYWELQYNVIKNLSNSEKQMIQIYYHNLVNTLTNDIHMLFTDNIEERMNLPFYQNILHVKVIK